MKTVKFYNKTTGRWEPIAGITRLGGVDNYEDLANKPDLSIYATKDDLEAMKQEIIDLINSLPSQPQEEPISAYYTEYTIDNSVNTFSLRGTNAPISDSQYMPKFSNGYTYIKLTLTDGRVTTNVNTPASSVDKVRIYYPEETTYVKFTDTKVKDVEYIQAGNFTDTTEMFKNCSSLEHADLSTLDNSKVQVDNTMFMGVNTDVQLQFNDEWSYTNRDMGLIKHVEVVMHHYREDGLYEYNDIYVKSQYDEHPTQYVIRQVDPEDGRWRYEPLYLEHDTPYEIYFEDNGNTGETMNACFMDNMDIFFVGGLPNTFTDSRPEIGGNEEPEEEYITGFTLDTAEIYIHEIGRYYQIHVIPNESNRPMNFVVDLPNSSWSVLTYDYRPIDNSINFTLNSMCMPVNDNITIRETYSGTSQQMYIFIEPQVNLTVHYKVTDGDFTSDTLEIGDLGTYYFSNDSVDNYGYIIQQKVTTYVAHHLLLDTQGPNGLINLGPINLSSDTEIWISDDSTEILYEKPNQPEEPSQEYITGFSYTIRDDKDAIKLGTSYPTDTIYITPNETGRPMNFIVEYPNSEWESAFTYTYHNDEGNWRIDFFASNINFGLTGYVTIRETYSGVSQEIPMKIIYKATQPEEPSEPSQEYITGFDVDPAIDSFVFDKVDNRTLNLNIYPYEQGRQVSFSVYLEDSTLANSDTLYPSIDTYEYDNGYNNAIYCSVNLQISDDLGTATLVIRESNSGIEKRISVSIVEPQPTITDFTISPESLTFSDDGNRTATVTIIPAETDRAMRFSYDIGSTSQFDITPDESEAPNKYYVNIEATQLYKEEYEPVFAVYEERSGINKSIPITIESENIWVNPNANVKVYYNRADGNYDNVGISYYSEVVGGGSGYWSSDDNGEYVDMWLQKGESYTITVSSNEDGLTLATGEFTITEDTSLWVIEGDSTIYTEKPENWPVSTPEEPSLPYYVEYTVHAIDDYALNSGSHAPTFYFDGGLYSPRYEITLKDGTITDDTNTMSKDVDHVKAYYDNSVYKIEFTDKEIKDVLHIDIDTIEIDYLFKGCKKLESVNVSNWDVSGKTRSSEMFSECESLITLDLSGWDTSNFGNITRMFMGCKSLKSLNLSGWDTTKVEAATQLFQDCYALETLNISGWDTSNFSFHDMMLSGVPETVNFIYEETNWTLTEEQTGFSGTFPWNQQ